MKVIIYQDYLRSGGTEWQSIFLAEQFQSKGGEVLLLTNRPGGDLSAIAAEKGIHRISLQSKDLHLNWRCPGLLKVIKGIEPSLIVMMGRNANSQGFRIKKAFPDIGLVATFRTGRKVPSFYRKTLNSADFVACNSAFVAERLSTLGIHPKQMEVHPNACLRADAVRKEALTTALSQFERFTPSHRLLYTAAFVAGKNHMGLLRVIQKLVSVYPDVLCYLVGNGPKLSSVQRQSQKMGIARNIIFTGFQKDVVAFYQQCDLAVSPSLEESMPNALVESQFAGLPVVAYDESGVKECFEPGVSGILVDRNDEELLFSSILKLIENPDTLESMSAAAKKYAKANFDPEIRFQSFYESVLKLAS